MTELHPFLKAVFPLLAVAVICFAINWGAAALLKVL